MIENILIVDDDPSMLMLISEVIHFPHHMRVLKTADLDQARSLCEIYRIDLVICDFHLKDGNGKELLAFLLSKRMKLTFILFTGSFELLTETYGDIPTYSITGKDLAVLKETVQSLLPLPH